MFGELSYVWFDCGYAFLVYFYLCACCDVCIYAFVSFVVLLTAFNCIYYKIRPFANFAVQFMCGEQTFRLPRSKSVLWVRVMVRI